MTKDQIKEYNRLYRKRNPDKIKETTRKWREINKVYLKQKDKEYKIIHRELINKKVREWYKKNRDTQRTKANLRYLLHTDYRQKMWARATIGNHRKKGIKVLFSANELLSNIKDIEKCQLCGKKLDWTKKGKLNMDSPSLDRIDNTNELRLDSIQLVCYQCNTTKGQRSMNDFVEYCKKIVKLEGLYQ